MAKFPDMNMVFSTVGSASPDSDDTIEVRRFDTDLETPFGQAGLAVFLVAPAAVALQKNLSKGLALTEALARWKDTVSALLSAQRYASDRICLLPELATLADPSAAKKAVAAWAGRPVQQSFPQGSSLPANDPAQELIARLMVAADPHATRLDGELKATALAWPGMASWGDVTAVDDLYERHRHFAMASLSPTMIQQMRLEMAAQREELHAFEAQLEGEALLRSRLEQAHEQLAAAEERIADLEAEHGQLRTVHDELTDWLSQIERSRSWRITAPLRAISRIRS